MYTHRCKQLTMKCTFYSGITNTFPKFISGDGGGAAEHSNDDNNM